MFSLELGDEVSNITCECCSKQFKSVVGFVKRDDDAYAVYFATLQTGHDDIAVGLTVSVGKWWDDNALNERQQNGALPSSTLLTGREVFPG
jgi:hypothetical protein